MYLTVAKPQKETDRLSERLALIASADTVDELALPRLERDARRLLGIDPPGARNVLGGLAALRGDVAAVRQHYEHAIALDNSFMNYYNYPVSLSIVEEKEDAFQIAGKAVEAAPDRPDVLDHAMKLALEAAHFTDAREYALRWRRLVPNEEPYAAEIVRALATAVETGELDADNAGQVLRIFHAIQREHRVWGLAFAIWQGPTEPNRFLYERQVRATPRTAANLNECFADHLAERDDGSKEMGLVSSRCSSARLRLMAVTPDVAGCTGKSSTLCAKTRSPRTTWRTARRFCARPTRSPKRLTSERAAQRTERPRLYGGPG